MAFRAPYLPLKGWLYETFRAGVRPALLSRRFCCSKRSACAHCECAGRVRFTVRSASEMRMTDDDQDLATKRPPAAQVEPAKKAAALKAASETKKVQPVWLQPKSRADARG